MAGNQKKKKGKLKQAVPKKAKKPAAKASTENSAENPGDEKLSFREARFVDLFVADPGNAKKAYEEAGYKAQGNAAYVGACRLLKKPKIQKALDKKRKELSAKVDMDHRKLLEALKNIALTDPAELCNPDGSPKPLSDIPKDARLTITSIKIHQLTQNDPGKVTQFQTASRIKALDMIARHTGFYEADNKRFHEHSGPEGGPVQHDHRIADMPPEPKDLAEWEAWHKKSMTAHEAEQEAQAQQQEGQANNESATSPAPVPAPASGDNVEDIPPAIEDVEKS
jgi:phage terminase small subunit